MQELFELPEKDIIANLYKLIKIRRTMCRDFLKFRQQYFSHYHKVKDGIFQEELSRMLSGITMRRGAKLAIDAPRECAKSTIVTMEFVLFCTCYRLERFIVIISNTKEQATGFLRDIKHELETNERLVQDFPDVCDIERKPKPSPWKESEIITRNGIKVMALGTGQQIRGRRNREFRPSLIILDDIEENESIQDADSYHKLEDWLTKSVLKAGTSSTNVIFVGTIHHYASLLAQFTDPKQFPGWEKRIYRSVVSWPERRDLWESWEKIYNSQESYDGSLGATVAQKFFIKNKKEMLVGAKVIWPESKSFYDLMVLRERDGHISFDSEMQNEPVNPRDSIFNINEIHYWDDRFSSEEELLESFSEGSVMFYGACDPSMGKENKKGDFSAIITVAKDTKTGKMYILDADIVRRLPDQTIDAILAHQKLRRYKRFGFEINNFQEFMKMELEKRSEQTGTYLRIEEVKHTSDKLGRIESLQPFVKNGTIQFSKKHHTLLEQMKFFPRGGHDDGLDALQMAVDVAIKGRKRIMTILYDNGRSEVLYNE